MIEISIIIPTFNSAKTINACLESVINQTFKDKEVIIVDGLSNDETFSIIKNISQNHDFIKVISEKDKGIYDAMNKGIDLAAGQWIYFLGSDDTLADKEVLSEVHNMFLREKKLEFLYGDVRLVPSGKVYGGKFSWFRLYKENISHQAIFYKKDIFSKIGKFQIEYKIVADWVLNIRCFNARVNRKYFKRIVANFSEDGLSSKNRLDIRFRNDFQEIKKENFPFFVHIWDYLKYRFT